MAAHMEVLAVLLAVTGGEIRGKSSGGWVTRKAVMGGCADCVNELILFERPLSQGEALDSCYQWVWSVFRFLRLPCLYISPAVTSHLEINKSTSLFNKKSPPHAFLTYYGSCSRSEECVLQKTAHTNHQTLSVVE